MILCWAAKGGSGTTVVACALALGSAAVSRRRSSISAATAPPRSGWTSRPVRESSTGWPPRPLDPPISSAWRSVRDDVRLIPRGEGSHRRPVDASGRGIRGSGTSSSTPAPATHLRRCTTPPTSRCWSPARASSPSAGPTPRHPPDGHRAGRRAWQIVDVARCRTRARRPGRRRSPARPRGRPRRRRRLVDRPLAEVVDHLVAARSMIDVIAERSPLGGLERWLDDAAIDEVIVNGTRRRVDRDAPAPVRVATMSTPAVTTAIEHILRPIGRRIDRTNPTVDARLPDGSRVSAVIEPVAVDGPCLTIRRFAMRPLPLARSRRRRRRAAAGACRGPVQRVGQRGDIVGQDDAAQRARRAGSRNGTDHHAGRHRRAAAAAPTRRAPRDPAGERRGHGRDHARQPPANRAADAARPARARRSPRSGGGATGAGDEHRPRRFDVDGPRQLRRRRRSPDCARSCCRKYPAGRSRRSTTKSADPSMSSSTSADLSATRGRSSRSANPIRRSRAAAAASSGGAVAVIASLKRRRR